MESWKLVLRDGFFPLWSSETLERALAVIEADDIRLVQGSTTSPPPLMCVQDWICEACCIVSLCGTDDPFNSTVGTVEEGFAKSCFQCDERLGEPAACRWFLNWADDTPRPEMLALLAAEIKDELSRRKGK